MSKAMQIAFRIRRWLFRRFRVKTHGVKVMVFNVRGELLLVRHSYGNRCNHLIPGGGIKPFEKPEAAALREVREEVGLEVELLQFVASYYSESEGKRDTVELFTAFSDKVPTTASREIDEATFFALDDLPDTLSPATVRRVKEHREDRMNGGKW
ncbi:MAG: NUDIX domain-containing protein [Allosphingosinicella sp.]